MESSAISGKMLCLHNLRRRRLQEGAGALHPGQIPLLCAVIRDPGLTQREIAARLGVTAASIAQSSRRMEETGLIVRKADESDRRRNMLYATEAGIAAEKNCRSLLYEIDARMLEGIPDRELTLFASLLDRMLENLRTEESDLPGFLAVKGGCDA